MKITINSREMDIDENVMRTINYESVVRLAGLKTGIEGLVYTVVCHRPGLEGRCLIPKGDSIDLVNGTIIEAVRTGSA